MDISCWKNPFHLGFVELLCPLRDARESHCRTFLKLCLSFPVFLSTQKPRMGFTHQSKWKIPFFPFILEWGVL